MSRRAGKIMFAFLRVRYYNKKEGGAGSAPPERRRFMKLPSDGAMLLSFLNTKLRDEYASLNAFCSAYDVEPAALCEKLAALNYRYAEKQNQFV